METNLGHWNVASFQPHPGQLYSMQCMNNNYSWIGPNTSSTTQASLMMSSDSGFHTCTLRATMSYGKISNNTCKNGMELNGTSPHPLPPAPSWISLSLSLTTESPQQSTKKSITYIYTSHLTQHTHLESSKASSLDISFASIAYATTDMMY